MKRINLRSGLCLSIGLAIVGGMIGGCGSGTRASGGVITTGQSGVSARLYMAGRFLMSASTYNSLKATYNAQLQQMGFSFDDAQKTLVFNNKPLRSMFLRANGQILGFTDSNGLVKMKSIPVGVTQIDVVNNVAETAILKVQAKQFGTLDSPAKIVITQDANLEDVVKSMDENGMNGSPARTTASARATASARTAAPAHTTARSGSATAAAGSCGGDCGRQNACCLDYDGGIPPAAEKQCNVATSAYHFLGSTCGKWYWEGVCREGMEIAGDEGVCHQRHRGRWCQQINDSDFRVTANRTKIAAGETVNITIHNNTRKNETRAELLQNIGSIETATPLGAGSGQTVDVAHYDGTAPSYTWQPDRTLVYHAPASLPDGQSKAVVTLRFSGQTGTTDIAIEIDDCQSAAARSAGSCR